jgi:hypothetical protein
MYKTQSQNPHFLLPDSSTPLKRKRKTPGLDHIVCDSEKPTMKGKVQTKKQDKKQPNSAFGTPVYPLYAISGIARHKGKDVVDVQRVCYVVICFG